MTGFPPNPTITIADADSLIAAIRQNDGRPYSRFCARMSISEAFLIGFIERNRDMIFPPDDEVA